MMNWNQRNYSQDFLTPEISVNDLRELTETTKELTRFERS